MLGIGSHFAEITQLGADSGLRAWARLWGAWSLELNADPSASHKDVE